MKIVVYTALFGDYDKIKPISENIKNNIDFICFTNNETLEVKGWIIKHVPNQINDDVLTNRMFKMLPHNYLQDYDYSVYIDSNIRLLSDIKPLVYKYMKLGNVACPLHPSRNCIYKESLAVIEKGKATENEVENQMKFYRSDLFPENHGLHEMNVIIRRHNENDVIKIMNIWWDQFNTYTKRDQLSFHYSLWKMSGTIVSMSENARTKNKYFFTDCHKNDSFIDKIKRKIVLSFQIYLN